LAIYKESEMGMLRVSLLVFGLCILAAPIALMAQDGSGETPPVCCPRSPELPGGDQINPVIIQGQFTISTGMLEAQGISRKQFVDRMSATFFPNKSADVVFSMKTTVTQTSLDGANAGLGRQNLDTGRQGLIAIQQTLFYRIPLYGLNAADFEAVEQLGLTDGAIQFTIKFVRGASLNSNAQ
jgi:hypothetical protein